jgi:hypothetical protein
LYHQKIELALDRATPETNGELRRERVRTKKMFVKHFRVGEPNIALQDKTCPSRKDAKVCLERRRVAVLSDVAMAKSEALAKGERRDFKIA